MLSWEMSKAGRLSYLTVFQVGLIELVGDGLWC